MDDTPTPPTGQVIAFPRVARTTPRLDRRTIARQRRWLGYPKPIDEAAELADIAIAAGGWTDETDCAFIGERARRLVVRAGRHATTLVFIVGLLKGQWPHSRDVLAAFDAMAESLLRQDREEQRAERRAERRALRGA